jgi:hypothetical protein
VSRVADAYWAAISPRPYEEDDAFSTDSFREMLSHIEEEIRTVWALVGLSGAKGHDLDTTIIENAMNLPNLRHWQPYEQ